ncbi:MAG: hypothetical protein DRI22_01350 [Caldiserica bacterium]|nr:MAG: hypothetical protein DRI22_01350 [Caldisericota bacterium]
MVYFSELQRKAVYDSKGRQIGQLKDLVFVDGTRYAEVTHLVYCGEDNYPKKIPFGLVSEFKEQREKGKRELTIKLDISLEKLNPFFIKESDLLVGDILDKQVVDVNGVKIVRVNDVLLGKVDGKFCVVAVAVGKRSFLRRLGLEWVLNFLPFKINEQIIPWESVERLEPKLHDIHLKIQKNRIADLHPEDIADVMEDLSHQQRVLIFKSLDKSIAARTLIEAEPEVQRSVFRDLKIQRIKDLLEDITPDQAADILSLMEPSKREAILNQMRKEQSERIRKILGYSPQSAGSFMNTSFIAVPESYTAQRTINYLRKLALSSEQIYHIYVVDKKGHLLGVLSIRGLITAPPKKKVSELMKKDVIFVTTSTTKEDVAKTIARYDLFVLPVVDENNILRGVVTADDVLDEIMPEDWRRERYRPLRLRRGENVRRDSIKAKA